jgi:hypothetical protein
LAQAAAKVFSSFEKGPVDTGAPSRVFEQLGQWMGHLSRNATLQWGPNLLDPYLCAFCDEDAVTQCVVCESPACLAHGLINHRADLVCEECVTQMVDKKKSESPRKRKRRSAEETHHHHHHHHHHQHRHEQSPPRAAPQAGQLQQAFLLLGLQPGATWEQVQTAYKAAAIANHPDRYQGEQKAQAEARLKNINIAYNVLKQHYQKAA